MRVSQSTTEATVTLTHPGTIFGKITGTSGKEWVDPNSQIGGN